jgi:hypothetical protein
LRVAGQADLSGTLLVRVDESYQYAVDDTFTIARVLPGHGNPTLDAAFSCLAGTERPGRPPLVPWLGSDRLALVASNILVDNEPPVAMDDTFDVGSSGPTVLDALANDLEPDGQATSFAWLSTRPARGFAVIDSARVVLTYYPPPQFDGCFLPAEVRQFQV